VKLAPVALALLFALAGCGGAPVADGPSGGDSPSPSPTETAPVQAAEPCTRDDLTIEFASADRTAGQQHGVLSLTNSAPSPCSVEGFPVVYLGSGEVEGPVGQPATPDPASVPGLVILQPGNVASSDVTIAQAGNFDGCDLAYTTHMIAAPPLDHPFDWELDGQHVDIRKTAICYNEDIGLLTVSALILTSS
jgi:hypothetical protein